MGGGLKNFISNNDLDDFEYLSDERRLTLTPAELRAFEEKNSFTSLEMHEQLNYKIEIIHLEKVLSSQKLEIEIPNYVNGRPSSINSELIKTALWIWLKTFMEPEEMHMVLKCYDTANLE